MSLSTSSAPGGASSAAESLPEQASPSVEERAGSLSCTLRYEYLNPAPKTDQATWTIKDTSDGNVSILFEVRRQGLDRVAFLYESKPIPSSLNLKEAWQGQKGSLTKTGYTIKLKKPQEFQLAQYFKPPTPPTS